MQRFFIVAAVVFTNESFLSCPLFVFPYSIFLILNSTFKILKFYCVNPSITLPVVPLGNGMSKKFEIVGAMSRMSTC